MLVHFFKNKQKLKYDIKLRIKKKKMYLSLYNKDIWSMTMIIYEFCI